MFFPPFVVGRYLSLRKRGAKGQFSFAALLSLSRLLSLSLSIPRSILSVCVSSSLFRQPAAYNPGRRTTVDRDAIGLSILQRIIEREKKKRRGTSQRDSLVFRSAAGVDYIANKPNSLTRGVVRAAATDG